MIMSRGRAERNTKGSPDIVNNKYRMMIQKCGVQVSSAAGLAIQGRWSFDPIRKVHHKTPQSGKTTKDAAAITSISISHTTRSAPPHHPSQS
jgi:hypothetical protein